MYAVITIFVCSKLIDTILYGTDIGTGKVLFIISSKSDEIADDILSDVDRGVTVLKSRGAYSGREGEVLLCAVRRFEVVEGQGYRTFYRQKTRLLLSVKQVKSPVRDFDRCARNAFREFI